jgi:hypothetical protein
MLALFFRGGDFLSIVHKFAESPPSLAAARKQPRDGHEDDGANRCRSQAKQKAATKDAELREYPAAEKRAHQSDKNIGDASKSAPSRNLSRKPAGEKADHQPRDHRLRNIH